MPSPLNRPEVDALDEEADAALPAPEPPQENPALDAGFSWGGGLHSSFSLVPPTDHLRIFLAGDGKSPAQIRAELPHDQNRSAARRGGGAADDDERTADPKRYRDPRQVYETIGLLREVEEAGTTVVRLTDFGTMVGRWLSAGQFSRRAQAAESEARALAARALLVGGYAVHALAACQLRSPVSVTGRAFERDVEVFPYAFIWRAMLELEDRISSDELNRVLFRVRNEAMLAQAIDRIAEFRRNPHPDLDTGLGIETITGSKKNDRIIPWVSLASFGWTLIRQKERRGPLLGYYVVNPNARSLLKSALAVKRRHLEFASKEEYVQHLSRAACVPPDLR